MAIGTMFDKDQLRAERFEHGAFAAEILLPLSSDELIEECEFNEDERMPYWAELWPSARALARHLLDEPILPDRVLELGCGVGLPSLALASRGVDVTATDYYDDALAFAELNSRHNRLPQPRTLNLDWRRAASLGTAFPLVIAADVLYEERNAVALAEALPTLVQPGGEMLLADPGRNYRDYFMRLIDKRGWTCVSLGERTEQPSTDGGGEIRVALFRLRPPGAG
jgi:predicted nicotinamide N-methyase